MVSIPERAFVYAMKGRELIPRFLGPGDHAWLASLIEAAVRSVGATRARLEENLADAAMVHAPERLGGIARVVLLDLMDDERKSPIVPRVARGRVLGLVW